jgi:hypothetical protein
MQIQLFSNSLIVLEQHHDVNSQRIYMFTFKRYENKLSILLTNEAVLQKVSMCQPENITRY